MLDRDEYPQTAEIEMRCVNILARLWHAHGRTTRARALLAPLYARFTEGFDAADLRAVEQLLKELGS